jgi:hypothetical protein
MVQPTGTTSASGQAEQLTQRFLQISRQTGTVFNAPDQVWKQCHPLRVLLLLRVADRTDG